MSSPSSIPANSPSSTHSPSLSSSAHSDSTLNTGANSPHSEHSTPGSLAQIYDQLDSAETVTASSSQAAAHDHTLTNEIEAPESKYITFTLPVLETCLRRVSEEYIHPRLQRALSASTLDSIGSDFGHGDEFSGLGGIKNDEGIMSIATPPPRMNSNDSQGTNHNFHRKTGNNDDVYDRPSQAAPVSPYRTLSPKSLPNDEDEDAEDGYRSPHGSIGSYWECGIHGKGLNGLGCTERLDRNGRLTSPDAEDVRSTTSEVTSSSFTEWMEPHHTVKSWMACEDHRACRETLENEYLQRVLDSGRRPRTVSMSDQNNVSGCNCACNMNKSKDDLTSLAGLNKLNEAETFVFGDRRRTKRLGDPGTGRRGMEADDTFSDWTLSKIFDEDLEHRYGRSSRFGYSGFGGARMRLGNPGPERLRGLSDVKYGVNYRLEDGSLIPKVWVDRFGRLRGYKGLSSLGLGYAASHGLPGLGGLGGNQTIPNYLETDRAERMSDDEPTVSMRGGGSSGPSDPTSPSKFLFARTESLDSLEECGCHITNVASILELENSAQAESSIGNNELQDADSNEVATEARPASIHCRCLPQLPNCDATLEAWERGGMGYIKTEQCSCVKQVLKAGEAHQMSLIHDELSARTEHFQPLRPLRLLLVDASATEFYKDNLSQVEFSLPEDSSLKESLEEASKQAKVRSQLSAQPSSSTSAPSQAQLLGRHDECTCEIFRVKAGQLPARPAHEELAPWEYTTIKATRDGRYIIADSNRLTWYLFDKYIPESDSDSNSIAGLKLITSGKYSPKPIAKVEMLPTNPGQGISCPCYDEIHGEGALRSFFARRYWGQSGNDQQAQLLPTNRVERKAYTLEKTHSALMKKYQAIFPYLDSSHIATKALQDANYLIEQADYVLDGAITAEEIVEFYSASSFDNDTPQVLGPIILYSLNGPYGESLEYPELDTEGKAIYPRAIQALKSRYLAKFPWIGHASARRKAKYDVFWLREQHPMHISEFFNHSKLESTIISFYDAEEWDSWKPEDEATDPYYIEARELIAQGKTSKWEEVLNAIITKAVVKTYLKLYGALKTKDWDNVDTNFDLGMYRISAKARLLRFRKNLEKENREMSIEGVIQKFKLEEYMGMELEKMTDADIEAQLTAETETRFQLETEHQVHGSGLETTRFSTLEGNLPFGRGRLGALGGLNRFSKPGGMSGMGLGSGRRRMSSQ